MYVKNGIKYTNITDLNTHIESVLLTLSILTIPLLLV